MLGPEQFFAVILIAAPAAAQGNVLLLIGDDLSVERIAAYEEHRDPGRTPNLDALAEGGLLFRNAWATPYCSPTRATMLTGRMPFRTGLGDVVPEMGNYALPDSEITLPELLRRGTDGTYRCAAIGKWHLAGFFAPAQPHPLQSGFDLHAGSLFNLPDYWVWSKSVNGSLSISATYATIDTTDDAIRAIELFPEPWFLWVAYNPPHAPLHAPPDHLHSYALSGEPVDSPVRHTKAMIEAMDTEIGRLLGCIPPEVRARTTVIFVGDNGTYAPAVDGPYGKDQAKGTCFEGGINVPLIVHGPEVAVPGSESAALVHTVDIYSTVAELAGFDAEQVLPSSRVIDSRSLVPYLKDPTRPSLRQVLFTEHFLPNDSLDQPNTHQRAVRNDRYKVIRIDKIAGPMLLELFFFDLEADPVEQNNLLEGTLSAVEREIFLRLHSRLMAP